MSITLTDIKNYLRINHNIDDAYIESLIETAKLFIKEQTGVELKEGDKVYEQGVFFLVAHLYDNRSPISEKAVNTVPYTLDAILKHIKIRGAFES